MTLDVSTVTITRSNKENRLGYTIQWLQCQHLKVHKVITNNLKRLFGLKEGYLLPLWLSQEGAPVCSALKVQVMQKMRRYQRTQKLLVSLHSTPVNILTLVRSSMTSKLWGEGSNPKGFSYWSRRGDTRAML